MKLNLFLTITLLCAGGTLMAQESPSNNPPRETRDGERSHDEGWGREPLPRSPEGGRESGVDHGRPSNEPVGFFHVLYPPELVLRNADAIGLKADQQEAIKNALPKDLAAAQEQQRTESKKLEQLLKHNPVDETQTMAQLAKLVAIENDFKREQLQALIKIKNILTNDQRAKLDELKQQQPQRRKEGELRSDSGFSGHEEPRFGSHEGGSHDGEEPHFGPREGGRSAPDNP